MMNGKFIGIYSNKLLCDIYFIGFCISIMMTIFFISSCGNEPKEYIDEELNDSSIIPIISNNKQLLKEVSTVNLAIGNDKISFNIYSIKKKNIIYFNIHDNENTSVKAVKNVIDEIGGKLIEIKASGNRLITFGSDNITYKFDPNRIYSEKGIRKTMNKYGNYSENGLKIIQDFSNFIKDSLLIDTEIIVALHNNSNSGYSINSYKKGSKHEKDALEIYINKKNDPDDFFYVTDSIYFKLLKKHNYNTILQDNINVNDDGSLSVSCAKKNIKYINIEAEHGHLKEQINMILVLQDIFNEK